MLSLRSIDAILTLEGYGVWFQVAGHSQGVPDLGRVQEIESVNSGYDSYGDSDGPCHLILKVTDDDGETIYVRKTGYSSSYDGVNWDSSLIRVHPVTKTVTVWE